MKTQQILEHLTGSWDIFDRNRPTTIRTSKTLTGKTCSKKNEKKTKAPLLNERLFPYFEYSMQYNGINYCSFFQNWSFFFKKNGPTFNINGNADKNLEQVFESNGEEFWYFLARFESRHLISFAVTAKT